VPSPAKPWKWPRHFDEILLDDYYFFDRKTDYDIRPKGSIVDTISPSNHARSHEDLIVKPAKAVNLIAKSSSKCQLV